MSDRLPIADILPALVETLRTEGKAVLQAPPGAGKTTMVPLALHEAGFSQAGRIVLLEPRRLAARGAAERMADLLGEPVGQTVGYRFRGEAKVSAQTRIEVVTEGILTRRLQNDPELDGVSTVIFDEFHERALVADLGLALCLEVRDALREDLNLLVMSATLDAAPVAALLGDAPLLTSEGRMHPVDIQHLDKPRRKDARLEADTAALVRQALAETDGSALVFLPGEGEIRRCAAALGDLPKDTVLRPLYGALPFAEQRAAIAPAASGRKVVLATAIAETSLTIEGVTAVVDAGRARRARFDPGSGMSRLVTERVSRAEAAQRAGRAGRLGPGRAYRLWTKGEEGALPAHPPAEIEAADLTGLALELAQWGSDSLPFLTAPPEGALAEARSLLRGLGALDLRGGITAHGRLLAGMPLHPRLAHMLAKCGPAAAPLAALLSDRDPMRDVPVDVNLRLRALEGGGDPRAHGPALRRIRTEAKRLAARAPEGDMPFTPARAAALAFPDRVGLRRPGDAPRWALSGGKGATMSEADPMATDRLLVALETDGDPREAKMRLAAPIDEQALREVHGEAIVWENRADWSKRDRKVVARRQERFGNVVLDDRIWHDAPAEALAEAALEGVRDLGLPWREASRRLQARALLYEGGGGTIAPCSDAALMDSLQEWLLPYLGSVRSAADIKALDLVGPLQAHIGWTCLQRMDALLPPAIETPLGRKVPIDYEGSAPAISVRLQELFGMDSHPTVGPDQRPLRITLLSPARRPVQVTMDLPGFWRSSYADVRKDMRGQYPKHPWPEDPWNAAPTTRAKPRGKPQGKPG